MDSVLIENVHAQPNDEIVGLHLEITPDLITFASQKGDWKKRTDVRILYGEQKVEMTFDEFFKRLGLEK